ncbi:hypothetical protein AGMMS49991_07660 [Spirochaetia bacterium]|nr:hypothetical protein AGMMS49991_07660 [Spirochaetia bacterium]
MISAAEREIDMETAEVTKIRHKWGIPFVVIAEISIINWHATREITMLLNFTKVLTHDIMQL